MYRKILIPKVNIRQPITKTANVLYVAEQISDLLSSKLTSDDWTYLRLSQGQYVEIVRVVKVGPEKLYVRRGIEFTTPCAFSTEALLEYALTAQELIDTVEVDALKLDSLGSVRIEKGEISIPPIKLYGLGGIADGLPIHERIEAICCGVTREPPEIGLDYWPLRETGSGQYRMTSEGDYRIRR